MPRARAEPRDRSMMRPRTKGPRSLMRTTTERPVRLFSTRTRVPKGRLRWAAVSPLGLKCSPFAVRWPLPYQEAAPLCAAAGRLVPTTVDSIPSETTSFPKPNDILDAFPLLLSGRRQSCPKSAGLRQYFLAGRGHILVDFSLVILNT